MECGKVCSATCKQQSIGTSAMAGFLCLAQYGNSCGGQSKGNALIIEFWL